MEEKEKLKEEFSLEDIMKEFGGEEKTEGEKKPQPEEKVEPEEAAQPEEKAEPEEAAQPEEKVEPEETTEQEEPAEPESASEPEAAADEEEVLRVALPGKKQVTEQKTDKAELVTEETVRIDRIPETAVSPEETIKLPVEELDTSRIVEKDRKATMEGETIRFEKIGNDTDPVTTNEAEVPEPEEKAEDAYSEKWEPEYEQPIGDYISPKPISFKPRSRWQEIKKKLVEGPERLYYTLSERGLGKLQFAIFLSILLVAGSALVTVLYAMNKIPAHRLRLIVFTQFWSLLVAGLLGCYQMLEGIGDIFRGKFTLNSMLFFSFLLCCADAIMGLKELRVSCCAAFSLQVTMSLWASCQKRNTRLGQLDTMRKATRLDSITAMDDYHEGQKGLVRGEGQVEHFMDTMDDTCGPEKLLRIYALAATVLCIGAGVATGIIYSVSTGIQVAAVMTLTALPGSMFVVVSRPMAILERRYHKLGTVICGWQGVKGMSGKVMFPLDHNDLFPAGTVKMNGVKFFGSRQPDELVAYATAMVAEDGGALEPLFMELLESRNGRHYTVTEFASYSEGGIGGRINDEDILVGSVGFLKAKGVEMPEGVRIHQAVCLAVNGEMCALFAIAYEKDRNRAAGLGTLSSYRNLNVVITTDDFTVSEGFIRERFDLNTKRILFPERETRAQLREKTADPERLALAQVTKQGLAPFAYAVTGARTLRKTAITGAIVNLAGGILGIAMMAALVILGATHEMTPVRMFLYQMILMIPSLLITSWTRLI